MEAARDTAQLFAIIKTLSEIPLEYEDMPAALARITDLGREALGSQALTLTGVDLENSQLRTLACSSDNREFKNWMEGKVTDIRLSGGQGYIDRDLVMSYAMTAHYDLEGDGQGIVNPSVARRYGLRSALTCPLCNEGVVLGHLNHFSSNMDRFDKDTREVLQIFANHAVTTIRTLRDRERNSDQGRFARLTDVMHAMAQKRDVDGVLEIMLDEGLHLLNCVRGWISRLNFETGQLEIVAMRGQPLHERPLAIGEGITGKALLEQRPIRANNIRSAEWHGVYAAFWPDTLSELAVPIFLANSEVRIGTEVKLASKRLGVFNAESPVAGVFTAADENILMSLAQYAAVLIDKIDRDEKLAGLTRIQSDISGRRDYDAIIERMMEAISQTLGYKYVNISLVDPERKRIRTQYVIGIEDGDVDKFKELADHSLEGNDIQASIVNSGNTEVPLQTDKRFDKVIYTQFGHDRLVRVYVPMVDRSENKVIGTVDTGYERRHREHIYESDVAILRKFVEDTTMVLQQRQRGYLDRISHELKAPITGIRNNADFLKRRLNDIDRDVVERKFDDIISDCDILLLQVDELQYILGGLPKTPKIERTFVFRDVIIKTIRQLKPIIIDHGFDTSRITFSTQDMRKIIPLYLDKARLNQVVYNLLINAIKYAHNDPLDFRIDIEVTQDRNCYIVSFKDWGIGIQQQYAEDVFREGFRTPEAKRKYVSGSGLGLAISRSLMRQMGGDLELVRTSSPTIFLVRLPKALTEAPRDSHYR